MDDAGMKVYDQERRTRPHERALRLVFEALTAVAVVACVVSAAEQRVGWTLLLAAVAWACFESAAEMDER
jgi:hypothetical protein